MLRFGLAERLQRDLPVHPKSPHAIDPVKIFTAFLLSVVAGPRRSSHGAAFVFRLGRTGTA